MELGQINMWAVLLAAGLKFVLGTAWYSPALFAGVWLREVGLTRERSAVAPGPMLLSAALGGVAAFTLAVIITRADLDFLSSLALGGLLGVGVMAALTAPQFAFEDRSFRLYAIYAGQYVAELLLMAAIIGGWR